MGITGMVISFFKNMLWLGFNVIESIVLYYGYNYFAPEFNKLGYFEIPEHFNYWFIFTGFIVIHYLGHFIKQIVPPIVRIKNKEKEA